MPNTAELSVPSGNVLWVLMAGNVLFVSLDRGDTWQQRGTATGEVSFTDDHEGWLLSVGSPETQCQSQTARVLHTIDGGTTWQELSATGIGDWGCKSNLSFVDAEHGFLIASSPNAAPVVYRTADGGQTWSASSPLPDPPGFQGHPGAFSLRGGQVQALGGQLLMSVATYADGGNRHDVYASDDKGATWRYVATPPNAPDASLALVTSARWLLVGPPQTSQETTDGGPNWHAFATDYTQAAPIAPVIVFGDAQVGYATVRGAIERTLDGGAHWTMIMTPGTSW